MSNDRIKVVGYSKKVSFGGGIEYRNFSPNLVGIQLTSVQDDIPIFTLGNFKVTTSFSPKLTKNFKTSSFSNFTTLSDLNTTLEDAEALLTNNAGVILNLNKKELYNYALFGSFKEFVRVSLENIIINWPAALYINPIYSIPPLFNTQTGYTVEDYVYDPVSNQASFKVSTNNITNNFLIDFLNTAIYQNSYTELNKLRNLTVNYKSYVVYYNDVEYNIVNFTAANTQYNDYLTLTVDGDVFSGTTNGTQIYHIKPNKEEENLFYNNLDDFENYLLNRLTNPKFTAEFNLTIKTDTGIVYTNDKITWPISDGYNIDFTTDAYEDYSNKLLEISTNYDLSTSNLMTRFLVAESITDFDTAAVKLDPLNQDSTDQKINKTLNIYGRSYDDINKYINGVKFANVVTYDKNNNTADIYLKNIAKVLGWDLISSVIENNLLKNYIEPKKSTYSGQSEGLTAVEADIELWRRLILNTPWLWKSKGTRKSIEFLFKFIGTPLGLINFNEYIYLAENKIDIDLFLTLLLESDLSTDLANYPITDDGYPNPKPNTSSLYYQNNGLWYRETGGQNANIDITSGNNPHVGPYDGGFTYINQFRELIPNFSATTLTSETYTTTVKNIFTNYNSGTMTAYSGLTFVDLTNEDDLDLTDCYVVETTIVQDPKGRKNETDCGCDEPELLKSLSVCIEKSTTGDRLTNQECLDKIEPSLTIVEDGNVYFFRYKQYNQDGSQFLVSGNPVYYTTPFIASACCNTNVVGIGGAELYYFESNTNVFDSLTGGQDKGFICCQTTNKCGCLLTCRWNLSNDGYNQIGNKKYLLFTNEDGNERVVSKDGCNCVQGYTTKKYITDPLTGEIGYGCELTDIGETDILDPASLIKKHYADKYNNLISCTKNTI